MKSYENSKIPRLFQLMEEKNIKAAQITRDIGISSGNISDWKSGKAFPTKGILVSLADYLDTTPEYLTGKTDIKEKPSEDGELENNMVKFIGRNGTVVCKRLSPEIIKMLESIPDSDEDL